MVTYEKTGKELCDIFDECGKDEFFFALMYLLHEKKKEINRDFVNNLFRELGEANW